MGRETWKVVLLVLSLVSAQLSLESVWAKDDNGQHKGQDKGKVSGKGHDKDGGKGHGKDAGKGSGKKGDDKGAGKKGKGSGTDSDLTECSAIFPDGAQTNKNGGAVSIYWHSRITGNPDNVLATKKVNELSGGTGCDSQACSASSIAGTLEYNTFKKHQSDISLGYNKKASRSAGSYKNVWLGNKAELTLSPGLYQIDGNLTLSSEAKIKLSGTEDVRLMVKGKIFIGHKAKINEGGDATRLLIFSRKNVTFNSSTSITGFAYSKENLVLNNKAHVYGAVNGKNVSLTSSSFITYSESDASNAAFDGLCKAGSGSGGGGSGGDAGTVLDYRFDNCRYNSTVEDSSASSYHGTPHAISGVSSAPVGNGLDLSKTGTSDWIDVPSSAVNGLSDFSVAVWVKSSVSKDQQEIIHALGRNDEDDQLEIALDGSKKVYVKVDDDSQTLSSSKTLTDGNWHHVVITRKGRNACLYVDGTKQDCESSVGGGTLSVTKSKAVVIGQEQDAFGGSFSSSQAYDGYLDELKIYDSQLSDDSIKTLYDSEKSGADRGEVEQCTVELPVSTWYQFDDCSVDSVLEDAAGSNNATPVSVKQDSTGKVGKALDLSAKGTSDWVKVPSAVVDGLDKFTIVVWVNTSVSKDQQEILHALGRDDEDDELELALKDSKDVYIKVRDDSQTLRSSKKLTDGQWHQLAITRDGRQACLYVDGVYQECESSVGSGTLSVPKSNAVVLGQEQDAYWGSFSSSQAFDGKLDEFRIYNSKLNSTQISEFYGYDNAGKNPDGTTRVDSCSVAKLSSLNITVSDGVTCEASAVTITALDADGAAYIPTAGTQVDLSSALPSGQWSLASGAFSAISSTQFDGSNSVLNLRFLPGSEGSSTLKANAASDAAIKGSATADFSNAALKFYYDNETEIIPTQIAGKVAGFKLRAIATDEKTGVCVAAASGDQDVTFTQSCVDPASCQTGATIGGKTFAANGSATAKLNFKDGWADFSYQYADAGKVKLTASMLTGAGIAPVKGESNSFISKPAGLCLKAVDAQAACSDATKLASCSDFKEAGKAFSIELSGRAWGTDKDTNSAYCDNDITPNFKLADIKLDHQLVAPTGDGTSAGTLSVGSSNKLSITTAGKVAVANTTVSEVGVFKLQAEPPAYMGQPLAETISDNIGRFTPAYFTQDDDKSFIDPACNSFSYIGQPFDLNLSLVPRNSAGAEVKNYQDIFQRMVGGTVKYGAIDGETDLSSRVPSDLTLQDKYISGNLIFPPFDLDRADTRDGPFDALNISLGFTDADAVPLESGEVDGVGDSVSLGTTVVRYGVMRIASNSGVADASTPLDLGISVEYYNGSGYTLVPKADEGNCSKVTATDVSVSVEGDDSSYSLDAIKLGEGTTAGSLHGDVNDSDGDPHKLQFSAPGEGNTGTINVTLEIGDWLYGEDGSKPAATAEFTEQASKSKVNDRVIYWLSN